MKLTRVLINDLSNHHIVISIASLSVKSVPFSEYGLLNYSKIRVSFDFTRGTRFLLWIQLEGVLFETGNCPFVQQKIWVNTLKPMLTVNYY